MNPIISLVLAVGMVSVPVQIPQPTQQLTATVYAYSSTVGQTDASPFVTASGERVRDGIVANNCLAFGTVVTFPELYGEKPFVVTDRMAPRMVAPVLIFGFQQLRQLVNLVNKPLPSMSFNVWPPIPLG